MCNKHATQPLSDVEGDLVDRCANGCRDLLLLPSRRIIETQQCAAIVELLRWDKLYWILALTVVGMITSKSNRFKEQTMRSLLLYDLF